MRRSFAILALICACRGDAPAATPMPLGEAATKVAGKLSKGAVVTAECVDGSTTYAAAGALEPAGTPPEKVIFEIGSISKVFTGLLLAQAVLEKKLTLDTTLREAMGGEQKFADPGVAAITLRQLATHTSGLPRMPGNLKVDANPADPYATYDRAMLNAAVAAQKLEGKPPFPMSYSNYGMGLLGDILSRLYGKSWEELVRERIAVPLGMRDTAVTLDEEHAKRFAPGYSAEQQRLGPWRFTALAGAGALRSTAADMVTFGRALLTPENTPLAEAISLARQPQTAEGGIGLAIMLNKAGGDAILWHNGATAGYRSLLQVTPATRTVQVVLASSASIVPEAILAVSRNEKPRLRDSGMVLSAEQLAAYEGVYTVAPSANFTVVRRGDQLWTQLTGQPFFRLFPHEKEDRFFLKVVAAELQFHRENGRIVSLTNHQNGREITATKSDRPLPKLIFRTATELAPYAGTYELKPGIVITVSARGETLVAQLTGQPPLPVFERRDDYFEYDVGEAALEFERDKAGKVTALKLHQSGIVQRAPRQAPPKQ